VSLAWLFLAGIGLILLMGCQATETPTPTPVRIAAREPDSMPTPTPSLTIQVSLQPTPNVLSLKKLPYPGGGDIFRLRWSDDGRFVDVSQSYLEPSDATRTTGPPYLKPLEI
jgi:hypothetical protein